MEAAVTGAGVERDVLDAEFAQHLGHHVAAPGHFELAGLDGALFAAGIGRFVHRVAS